MMRGLTMRALPFHLVLMVVLAPLIAAGAPAWAEDFDLAKLNDGGYVLLLRHVTAGGVDSDDLVLADCRTQRQVGATGRAQATDLAARLRAAGIASARVLSSQWCRALQTAELLGLGPVTGTPELNYFHWRLDSEEATKATLRSFYSALEPPAPGAPLVLVSHVTAFHAMGLEAPSEGGGLVLLPNGTANPQVVGAVSAPKAP